MFNWYYVRYLYQGGLYILTTKNKIWKGGEGKRNNGKNNHSIVLYITKCVYIISSDQTTP